MGQSRKDQVYVVSNFFVLLLAGFVCFVSSDFIRLLTFDTVGNETYWIFVYHIIFWLSTIGAMLVKTPAAPALMYCLRLNVIFMLVASALFLMKWFGSVSCHLIITLWAYLSATAMINAVTFASYHNSGSRGLAIGCILSFCTSYIVLEILKYIIWTHNEAGGYRNLVVAYIAFKVILSFVTMASLSSSAGQLHFLDFDRAFRYLKKGVLLEWTGGTLHETDVRIALSEVVPRYVSPIEGINQIKKNHALTVVWVMLIVLTLTCSVFTPQIGVSNWDLSIFRIGELNRAEHVGNFIGGVVGALWGRSWSRVIAMALVYLAHVVLSLLLTCYVHSYRVSLVIPIQPVVAITCITAILGSYVSVVAFIRFFDLCMDITCTKKAEAECRNTICCRDDDSNECLCSEMFCSESCGNCPDDGKTVEPRKMRIFVAANSREMYKLWLPQYCVLCWLYRHNPSEVCSLSGAVRSGRQAGTRQCDVKNYVLRNCKVSICPYCDMNMLMECENLQCTCTGECNIPLPNANEVTESEVEGNEDEDSDEKPIKLPLHEMKLPCHADISLVTNASSTYVIGDSACCDSNPIDCLDENGRSDLQPNGRTFDVTSVLSYSCCHYALKVMIKCKDPKSRFSLMQKAYPGKYNPIGSIVFNGVGTSSRDEGMGESQCINEEKGDEKKKAMIVTESQESTKHAVLTSKVSSVTKLGWIEDPKGENGLCICCKHAKEVCGNFSDGSEVTKTPAVASPSVEAAGSTCKNEEESSNPKCCHIKVQPTALPYPFRKKDIYRSSFVGALFLGYLFYGVARLMSSGIFALIEIRHGLDLSSNFSLVEPFYKQSIDSNTYGISPEMTNEQLLRMFEKEREEHQKAKVAPVGGESGGGHLLKYQIGLMSADAKDGKLEESDGGGSTDDNSVSSSREQEDGEKLTLLQYEFKQMKSVMVQYKWLFNDLEYAYLKNWAYVLIDMKNDDDDDDVEKMKRIRRVKWCLESGLKDYSLQSTRLITKYLEYVDGKWQAEWTHYESRAMGKVKLVSSNMSILPPVRVGKVPDDGWQPSVTMAKIALWKSAYDVVNGITAITKKSETLKLSLEGAKGTQKIVELLNLWGFRVEIIESLTKEGDLFLSWSMFLTRWDKISRWSELFLPMYLAEYKNLKEDTRIA